MARAIGEKRGMGNIVILVITSKLGMGIRTDGRSAAFRQRLKTRCLYDNLTYADRRPPTADRRPPTADRRPPTADRMLMGILGN